MKKLLSILSISGIIGSASTSVVSCNSSASKFDLDNFKINDINLSGDNYNDANGNVLNTIETELSKQSNISFDNIRNDENLTLSVKESDGTEINTNILPIIPSQNILFYERATAGNAEVNISINKKDKYFNLNKTFDKHIKITVSDNRKELSKDFNIKTVSLKNSFSKMNNDIVENILYQLGENVKLDKTSLKIIQIERCLLVDINYTSGSKIEFNSNDIQQMVMQAEDGIATITISDQTKGKDPFVKLDNKITFKNVNITDTL